jgi:chaperonin GroES
VKRTQRAMDEYTIVPLSGRILFLKDDASSETKGGIVLPDTAKQENLTGRVLAISPDVENDDELPIRQYDKVLVNPTRAIPVELDSGNKQFIIPIDDVIAVWKRNEDEGDE